jgi:tRNA(His) 5'-end guanylyltransferase
MKFDDLDKLMRVYETAADLCVLPGVYIVARLDGRNFTKLTKANDRFDLPFDTTFRNMMVDTTKHLMNCGFNAVYGFTESDEISLLFDPTIDVFGRKLRKYNSILAGEASATFSLLLHETAVFDCRISQLPRKNDVADYFRWRNEDANRNALNSHCYWMLRKNGFSKQKATAYLTGKSVADKNELLLSYGVNFNDLPNWQKRGVGLYWEEVDKIGHNPMTGQDVIVKRRVLKIDYDLPMKEEYGDFIEKMIDR